MFAKQKSCTIIDVEKRIFFSGVSDQQEKSYENIPFDPKLRMQQCEG